jgi:hypothetical protein
MVEMTDSEVEEIIEQNNKFWIFEVLRSFST